jgi:hypothetical protein
LKFGINSEISEVAVLSDVVAAGDTTSLVNV